MDSNVGSTSNGTTKHAVVQDDLKEDGEFYLNDESCYVVVLWFRSVIRSARANYLNLG